MDDVKMRSAEVAGRFPLARPLLWTAALMLFAAVPPVWPYGYYTFLRLVVCGVCLYTLIVLPRKTPGIVISLTLIALLFNPIIPVHLTKFLWIPIDIGVGIVLFLFGLRLPSRRSACERTTIEPEG